MVARIGRLKALPHTTRHNLLTYSEDMSQGQWTTATLSAIQATKLVDDSNTNAQHRADQAFSFAAGVYTLQVLASPSGRGWLRLRLGSTNTCYFDITTGAIGTLAQVGVTAASIVSYGSGKYLCTLTATPDANFVRIGLATGDNGSVYNGDGVSGAFIHRVQLIRGSSIPGYIKTTSAAK